LEAGSNGGPQSGLAIHYIRVGEAGGGDAWMGRHGRGRQGEEAGKGETRRWAWGRARRGGNALTVGQCWGCCLLDTDCVVRN